MSRFAALMTCRNDDRSHVLTREVNNYRNINKTNVTCILLACGYSRFIRVDHRLQDCRPVANPKAGLITGSFKTRLSGLLSQQLTVAQLVRNPNVHYRVHMIPPPDTVPRQPNPPTQKLKLHFLKMHFKIILM